MAGAEPAGPVAIVLVTSSELPGGETSTRAGEPAAGPGHTRTTTTFSL